MLIEPDDPRRLWLVLRTKPKQERVVTEVLSARDVVGYCPQVLAPRTHRRAPHGPVPLFPSYVFASCVVRERFAAVHYCPGALGVVQFGDRVAALEDEIVAELRRREEGRGYLVVADVRHPLARGARVRIVEGPLAGLEGIVERYMSARDRVRLLLQLVTGTRTGEVEAAHVRGVRS